MTKDEALKLALDALEQWNTPLYKRAAAITAIREALEEPSDKPAECTNGCPPYQVCDWCQRKPADEPVAWKNAAIRLGEELSSVGPDGYYDMTAQQWLDWAMDQQPQGKNLLPTAPQPADEPVAWRLVFDDGHTEITTRPVADWKRLMWESGGKKWTTEPLYTHPQPAAQRVLFPTMLRKMWSGSEVQAWIDENVNKEKNT